CVHRTLFVFERKTICLCVYSYEKRKESAEKEWKNKKLLINILNELLDPIRERRRYFEERIEEVYAVLEAGTERARRKASETLHDVRNAMRINYFEDKELIAAQAKAYAEKN
ncbi:MAG: hypothetical protein IIX78_04715, partial [Alistipes sp.]|nr:hypothetical protein [Alistipes sp.]